MNETLSKLSAELAAYCNTNGLPHDSADELACRIGALVHNLRQVQADAARDLARLERVNNYLQAFLERWNNAAAQEDMVWTLQSAGFASEVCGGGARMWHRYGATLYAVISGLEGDELRPGELCTLGVYDPADGGDSIIQADFSSLHYAIKAAARLVL